MCKGVEIKEKVNFIYTVSWSKNLNSNTRNHETVTEYRMTGRRIDWGRKTERKMTEGRMTERKMTEGRMTERKMIKWLKVENDWRLKRLNVENDRR